MLSSFCDFLSSIGPAVPLDDFENPSFTLPCEPKESHVTPKDILTIGGKIIGYRHVSSEEHAQYEAINCIRDGCALNISFCDTPSFKHQPAIFFNLDQKIRKGEECSDLIKKYETALTSFIGLSIEMDITDVNYTYRSAIYTVARTRFMLIARDTPFCTDADDSCYGGLGRFPNGGTPPEKVILLNRINKQ